MYERSFGSKGIVRIRSHTRQTYRSARSTEVIRMRLSHLDFQFTALSHDVSQLRCGQSSEHGLTQLDVQS